jgi:hypothetical protein
MRVTLCTTQVNSQVIRPEEKAMLSRLVNIMVSLELRFVQERAEDGQLLYRLDPWVWGLCPRWPVVANVRQQASGFIRDIRWQACSGYSASALCREAPCCHRGQSTLTPCQEVGSGAMANGNSTSHSLFDHIDRCSARGPSCRGHRANQIDQVLYFLWQLKRDQRDKRK